MNQKLTQFLIFVVLVMLPGIGMMYYKIKEANAIIDELDIEYPTISLGDNVNGIVTYIRPTDLEIFRQNPYNARVILNDSQKMSLNADDDPLTGLSLDELLKVGDRLVKEINDNRVIIYQYLNGDTLTYSLELLDDRLYPLKK